MYDSLWNVGSDEVVIEFTKLFWTVQFVTVNDSCQKQGICWHWKVLTAVVSSQNTMSLSTTFAAFCFVEFNARQYAFTANGWESTRQRSGHRDSDTTFNCDEPRTIFRSGVIILSKFFFKLGVFVLKVKDWWNKNYVVYIGSTFLQIYLLFT